MSSGIHSSAQRIEVFSDDDLFFSKDKMDVDTINQSGTKGEYQQQHSDEDDMEVDRYLWNFFSKV